MKTKAIVAPVHLEQRWSIKKTRNMELTLYTSDYGGACHVPVYGLLSGSNPNTQTTIQSTLNSDNRENFYFIQFYNDIPIFGTEIITTLDSSNTVVYLLNNCVNLENIQSIRSDIIIGKQEAIEIGLNKRLVVKQPS